jgi:hypothetical protein
MGMLLLEAPLVSIKSFALAILLVPDNWMDFTNSMSPIPFLLFQKVKIMGRFTPVMTSTLSLSKKEKAMFEGEPAKMSVQLF